MQKEIYRLMLIHGFKPNPKFDQNFILDNTVIEKTIECIKPNKKEIALEIGPGLGFLTKELLKKFKKVIVIEKDPKMVEILKKEIKNENLEIIEDDFLNIDLNTLKFDKIVGFIPYSISLKIIEKIISTKPAALVVQKEFAEKLISFEGYANYVSISVLSQTYSDVKIEKKIKKSSFFPKPKVESAIISLIPNKRENNLNYNKFIKNIFRYPNKDVLKALKHAQDENKDIVNPSNFKNIPEKIYVKKIKQLSIKEFLKIFEIIKK